MIDSNACAVQILLVAFSRLICCSRVWSAILKAWSLFLSTETPINLPGIALLNSSFVAKKAA